MKQRFAIIAAAAALIALAVPGIAAAANVQVVAGKAIGTHGMLLVATKNDMTLYTFDKDVAGSGVSNCIGGCLTVWPALTVNAGDTPTGGAGVTGTLGTIIRTDNGAIQVTYDGKPLYFFANDKAPGDTNGIYANWRAVVLAAAAPSATSSPTSTAPTGTVPVATQAPAPTPPPTSTTPGGDGPSRGGDSAPLLLVTSVAVIGCVGALRRLVAVRS